MIAEFKKLVRSWVQIYFDDICCFATEIILSEGALSQNEICEKQGFFKTFPHKLLHDYNKKDIEERILPVLKEGRILQDFDVNREKQKNSGIKKKKSNQVIKEKIWGLNPEILKDLAKLLSRMIKTNKNNLVQKKGFECRVCELTYTEIEVSIQTNQQIIIGHNYECSKCRNFLTLRKVDVELQRNAEEFAKCLDYFDKALQQLKCFKIDNKYIAEFSLHHENEAKETNENPISIVAQREESSETKQFISNLQAKHSQNEYKKIEFNCKELNETMAELKPREHEVLGRYNLPKDILLISLIENKH